MRSLTPEFMPHGWRHMMVLRPHYDGSLQTVWCFKCITICHIRNSPLSSNESFLLVVYSLRSDLTLYLKQTQIRTMRMIIVSCETTVTKHGMHVPYIHQILNPWVHFLLTSSSFSWQILCYYWLHITFAAKARRLLIIRLTKCDDMRIQVCGTRFLGHDDGVRLVDRQRDDGIKTDWTFPNLVLELITLKEWNIKYIRNNTEVKENEI